MNVEIRDGVQIITHASGKVDVYGITYIEEFRSRQLENIKRLQKEIIVIDAELKAMKASQAPLMLKRIVNKVLHKKE